ncbi:MAG: hypothetical protein ACYC1K_00045 [Minisyncoccota bacterium]
MTEKYEPSFRDHLEATKMMSDEEARLSMRREDILAELNEGLVNENETDLKFINLYGGNDPAVDDGIIEGTVRGHKVRLFKVIDADGQKHDYAGVIDGIDVEEKAAQTLFKVYSQIVRRQNYLENGDESLN